MSAVTFSTTLGGSLRDVTLDAQGQKNHVAITIQIGDLPAAQILMMTADDARQISDAIRAAADEASA